MRRRRIIRENSRFSAIAGVGVAALAGLAVGMYLTHRGGGLGPLLKRLRAHRITDERDTLVDSVYEMDGLAHDDGEYGEAEDALEADASDEEAANELEERVLSAFLNDPVLSSAPIEISAEGDGVVTLSGVATSKADSHHAAKIAGGVPGVLGVSNAIRVRNARRELAK